MQLTIDIKNNAIDKVMYLLEHLKSDVTIISKDNQPLDIEVIDEKDKDYQTILKSREDRKANPNDFQDLDSVNWN